LDLNPQLLRALELAGYGRFYGRSDRYFERDRV